MAALFLGLAPAQGGPNAAKTPIVSGLLVDVYASAQGLPQSTVQSLAREPHGYLWMATQAGLARFDGVRFQTFQRRNSPGIPQDDIHAVMMAHDGTLWIGTYTHGVVRFAGGKFQAISGSSNSVIRAFAEDREGALWIATAAGLNRWRNGTVTTYVRQPALACDSRAADPSAAANSAGPLLRTMRRQTTCGLASDSILSIAVDLQDKVWVGTSAGLSLLDGGNLVNYPARERFSRMRVESVLAARDGSLWVAASRMLARIKNGEIVEQYRPSQVPSNEPLTTLAEDSTGSLWIGTFGAGLLRLREGRFEKFGEAQGLSNSVIYSLLPGENGSLWVGTNAGGLDRLRPRPVAMIGAPEGLSDTDADAVLEARDGSLWIATQGGGLNHDIDGKIRAYTTRDGLSSNAVMSVWQGAHSGTIWAATRDGALNWFDGRRFQHLALGGGLLMTAILEDRDGVLWVASKNGLLRVENGRVVKIYRIADGIADESLFAIAEARDGGLWLGTNNGFSHFRNGRFINYGTGDPSRAESRKSVLWLREDAGGVVWLGSEGNGVGMFKKGRITWAGVNEGLNDDVAYAVLPSGDDIWFSTNRGIGRVARQQMFELAAGRRRRLTVHVYDTSDGLRSTECYGGTQPGAWKRRDGQLLFACIGGVASIDPTRVAHAGQPPAVRIEEARINGVAAAAGPREAIVPPGNGNLEFTYTAIDFSAPRQLRFRYRLENIDEGWVDAGSRRTAYYTNIPPGSYRFRVAAVEADGTTNEAAMAFVIEPHFHETLLFKFGCAALGLVVVALLYGWRTRSVRTRRKELEHLVDLRTEEMNVARQEAEAASRAKSQFLANMSHEIRTPMHGILGMIDLTLDSTVNGEQKQYLELARSSANALLGIINDILDFSKIEAGKVELDPSEFSLGEFVEQIVRTHAIAAWEKGLELVCRVSPDAAMNVVADRTRMGQVLTNLIGNAIKFTSAGEVVASVDVDATEHGGLELRFTVRDSGIGIAREKVDRIFAPFLQADASTTRRYGGTGLGLTISASLVKLMGGRIRVESAPGEGSAFSVMLPAMPGRETTPVPALSEKRGRVLIADDNASSRGALAAWLRRWGMDPVEAVDGEDAWRQLHAPGIVFDLALLDADMPGKSGWELAAALTAEGAGRRVVVLNAVGSRRKEVDGVAAVVSKPIAAAELRGALDGASEQRPMEIVAASNPARGLRILVAEDNVVNQTLARRLLERNGHEVTIVGDGSGAVQALEAEAFDLVLMDVQMPVMDGLEASRQIRSRETPNSRVPIIAMTANAMSGDREVCLDAGMDGYVSKPVSPAELFAAIDALQPD